MSTLGRRSVLVAGAAPAGRAPRPGRAEARAGEGGRGRSSCSPRRAAAPARRPTPSSASSRAARHRRALLPCRLLGLHRLEGPLRQQGDHRAAAHLRPHAQAALRLYAGDGGRRPRQPAGHQRRPDRGHAGRGPPPVGGARDADAQAHGRRLARSGWRRRSSTAAGRRHAVRLRPAPFDADRARRERGPADRQLQRRAPLRARQLLERRGSELDRAGRPLRARPGLAVLVQQADQGPVLGANKLEPVVAG